MSYLCEMLGCRMQRSAGVKPRYSSFSHLAQLSDTSDADLIAFCFVLPSNFIKWFGPVILSAYVLCKTTELFLITIDITEVYTNICPLDLIVTYILLRARWSGVGIPVAAWNCFLLRNPSIPALAPPASSNAYEGSCRGSSGRSVTMTTYLF